MTHTIVTKSSNTADDFQTPPNAISPLLPFLKKGWALWECACGKGNLSKALEENNFNVHSSDIKDSYEHKNFQIIDFLKVEFCAADCIITNPPYSKKNEFIEKCYELNKPFALLLPLTALETARRQKQWAKGVELIIFNKRLNFETPNNKKSHCWFPSAWFTHGLNLPHQLMFQNS